MKNQDDIFLLVVSNLQKTLTREIKEIKSIISNVQWIPSFRHREKGKIYGQQTLLLLQLPEIEVIRNKNKEVKL
jgi:hypothetical protein